MKNNYVTIAFVQLKGLAALLVEACPEFTFKIRVFQRFRGGSGAFFALVSTLHFGRLCPNYGRLCTFWGRKRSSSCLWICHQGSRQILLQYKIGALLLYKACRPSTSTCLLNN